MEVHFTPDVQAKLDRLARESGCPSDELVEDAVIGYFDELAYAREMLDRRYDELESGRVAPIDGEEAFRRLMEKTEARRRHTPACCGLPRAPKPRMMAAILKGRE